MNAHINHDLALAVVRTCRDRGISPHRRCPLADLVANFSIDMARDAAWVSALTLWEIRNVAFPERAFTQALSGTVGLVSRQLLVSFGNPLELTQPFTEAELTGEVG